VGTLFRGHRIDDAHLVSDLGTLREILGDLEITGGANRLNRPLDFFISGLGIEGIEMAHSTSHIEEDDVFGLCSAHVFLTEGRTGKTGSEHGRETHSEVASRGVDHELTTAKLIHFVKMTVIHCFYWVRFL
jgi:hypothetical protein